MTAYGFVVTFWLVFYLEVPMQYVPFATMEACQAAKEQITKDTRKHNSGWGGIQANTFCVPTGATVIVEPLAGEMELK